MLRRGNGTFMRYFKAYNDDYCIMLLTTWRFSETCSKFSRSKSPRVTKKRIIQRNIPLRTITPRGNPLSIQPQISLILDQTPFSATCPHVIEGP